MHELAAANKVADANILSDPDKLEVLFKEMTQICLWFVIDIASSSE